MELATSQRTIIRPAENGDLPALQNIYLVTRREAFYWQNPERHRLEDFVQDTKGEHVSLAEEKGKPVGFISWWQAENFIHHLYVSKAFRNLGIGKALLAHCLEHLQGPAYLKCLERNRPAVEFYIHNGWSVRESGCCVQGRYYLMELRR